MSGRIKSDRSATAVSHSGQLGVRLAWHAGERIKRLFMFLFAVDAACGRMNALTNSRTYVSGTMIREKASHQIDVGLRSSNDAYEDFNEADAGVVNLPSTHFGKTDAAHYCNLGLTGEWDRLKRAAPANDPAMATLIDLAERCAGDTVQLPQRVNIGPDRIIDQLHWAIGQHVLGRGPVVSAANVQLYAAQATTALNAYIATLLSAGKQGVAACTACYLQAYANTPLEEIYVSIRNSLGAEAEALKLKTADYVT